MERKLAAILHADVADYSRLVKADEDGALAALEAARQVFREVVERHGGRIVDMSGDSVLAVFAAATAAVRAAVETQEALGRLNEPLVEHRRMRFRIGINLGEVIEKPDGTVFGDGVNVAARLEALAEPGSICASGRVVDEVDRRLDIRCIHIGRHRVKNIDKPIDAYRILVDPTAVTSQAIAGGWQRGRKRVASAAAAVMLMAVAGLAWLQPWRSVGELTPVEEHPLLPPKGKPSVAVLPFANMSRDREQAYFAAGMSEDLLTDLARVSGLFVIARDTVFREDLPSDPREIGERLGVRFTVHGSVRRAGDDVRINIRLVDAETGEQIWASRYDGDMVDVFELQDAVTRDTLAALERKLVDHPDFLGPEVDPTERMRHETRNPRAYDLFLRGWRHFNLGTPEDMRNAIRYLEQAIEHDPDYARAYAALAAVYWRIWDHEWAKSLNLTLSTAARRARHYLHVASKSPSPLTYFVSSQFDITQGLYDDAIAEAERALVLEPNSAVSALAMGIALVYAGEPKRAETYLSRAVRLDPEASPPQFWLAFAQYNQERFREAAETLEHLIELQPRNDWAFLLIAAAYGQLGRIDDAEAAIARFDELAEGRRDWQSHMLPFAHYWAFKDSRDFERLRVGWQAAGAPARVQRVSGAVGSDSQSP